MTTEEIKALVNEEVEKERQKKEGEVSKGVQSWVNDKATGGLGGKQLDGIKSDEKIV